MDKKEFINRLTTLIDRAMQNGMEVQAIALQEILLMTLLEHEDCILHQFLKPMHIHLMDVACHDAIEGGSKIRRIAEEYSEVMQRNAEIIFSRLTGKPHEDAYPNEGKIGGDDIPNIFGL